MSQGAATSAGWDDVSTPVAAPKSAAAAAPDSWDTVSAPHADYSNLPIDYHTGGSLKAHALASLVAPANQIGVIQQFHPGAFVRMPDEGATAQRAGIPRGQLRDAQGNAIDVKPEIVFPTDDAGNPAPPGGKVKATKLVAFTPHGLAPSDLADMVGNTVRGLAQTGGAMIGSAATEDPLAGAAAGIGIGALMDAGVGELSNYVTRKALDVPEHRSAKEIAADAAGTAGTDVLVGGSAALAGAGAAYAKRAIMGQGMGGVPGSNFLRNRTVEGTPRPDVAAAIERQNVNPDATAGLITENKTVQNVIDAQAQFPRAATRWQAAVKDFRSSLENAWQGALNKLGAATEPVTAGAKAQGGILKWAEGKSLAQQQLEGQVEQNIGSDTLVDAGGLLTHINEMERRGLVNGVPLKSAKQVLPAFLGDVKADIEANNGQLPFGHLRDLREKWDGLAGWNQVDVASGTTPKIYRDAANAARHDLSNGAYANGQGPVWKQAMQNWTEREETMDQLGRLANNTQAERAFTAITSGDRLGPTLLNQFKQTVENTEPGAWGDVMATRMKQLATDKSGQFDPVAFEGVWGKGKGAYPDSVKNLIAPQGSEMRQTFDDLALIGQRMRETGFNQQGSQTARRLEAMNAIGEGGPGAAVKLGANLGAAVTSPWRTVSRYFGDTKTMLRAFNADQAMQLYQSPEFRAWLLAGQRTPPLNPNGMAAHLSRLAAIGTKNTNLQAPLRKLADQITEDLGNQQDSQQSGQGAGNKGGNGGNKP